MSGRVNIGGVEIDVRADGTLLVADLKRAEQQAKQFGERAGSAIEKGLNGAIAGVRTQLLALLSAGALAAFAKEAVQTADAFTSMRSRLSLVVAEGENLLDVEENLAKLALKNRADLGATVSLYARLRTARKDLSDETTTRILDAWSKTLVISGANATEAASATLQFAQAMGSGRLQGAELTAVLENNSRASRLIADSLGVPIGQLKKLGEEGKLTTDSLIKIFTQAGALDGEFAKMSMTVGQAGTNFQTAFTRVIGLLDQSTGLTRGLAGWIDSMAQSLLDLGVALAGPLAEATAALDKMEAAQNSVVDDTELLTKLQDKLKEAIEKQGPAAQSAAQLEIDAVNKRINANTALLEVYKAQALQKLQQAKEERQKSEKPGAELDRLLFNAPQTEAQNIGLPNGKGGVKVFTKPGQSPRDVFGNQDEIFGGLDVNNPSTTDSRFGDRASQLANVKKQIEYQLKNKIDLTDVQKQLVEYFGSQSTKELEEANAEEFLKAIEDAIAAGKKVIKPGAPKTAGTTSTTPEPDDKKKKSEFTEYASAVEKYDEALQRLRASKEADLDKSRAAITILQEYIDATGDFEGAESRLTGLGDILSGGDWGILWEYLARARKEAGEITNDEDFVTSVLDSYGGQDKVIADTQQQVLQDLPEFKSDDDYWKGFGDEISNATKRGLFDAIQSGDYGDLLSTVIGDAASDGLARAVDQLVDSLWELLSKFDWGSIFKPGEGGGGGVGDFISSIFGGNKASGGQLMGGRAYRTGEMGPEIFVPKTDGYLIPNQLGKQNGSDANAMPRQISIATTLNIPGLANGVTREDLANVLDAHTRTVGDQIDARIRDGQRRGSYE